MRNQDAPEPPLRYLSNGQPLQTNEDSGPDGRMAVNAPNLEFASVLKLARIAQVMALVSLVIGGVLLAAAAMAVAVISYRRAAALRAVNGCTANALALQALKRVTVIAVVMSILALGVNAIAFAMVYPTIVEMMQTGDYASVFGSEQSASDPSTGSGGSFWG